MLSHIPSGGIERVRGGTKVAHRPRPLGFDQPQQVQEVVGRVRSAGGEPLGGLIQLGQHTIMFVALAGSGLFGEGEPAQQMGHGGRVGTWGCPQERHRRRAMPPQVDRIVENGSGDRAALMRKEKCQRVLGVPFEGDGFTGVGGTLAAE